MMSLLPQSESFDDITTSCNDQDDITTVILTEELSTEYILSIPISDSSCEPYCNRLGKPNGTDVTSNKEVIFYLFVIIAVITICIVIIVLRFQHSQKQQKKKKECLQSERLYAHPFEEVVIVIDQPESIELLEIGTATTTTTN